VVTVHDCIYRHFTDYLGRRFVRRQLIRATERYAIGAETILTDSEFSRRDVAAHVGIPPERLQVLYPWVDHRSFDPIDDATAATLRARLRLPRRFWLYVGGYDYRKNVELLIAAYTSARSDIPSLPPLVLAGKIPPAGRRAAWCDIHGAIARAGLPTEAIVLPGLIEPCDLPVLYSLAALLVYPSLMEGFGLPPAEAMAMATPVLASNASSLPEVVRLPHCRFDPNDVDELRSKLVAAASGESQFRCPLPEEFTEGFAVARYLQLLGLQAPAHSIS
jgi:glycosyltransferase involved in cell wall biosynthesis